MSIVDTIQNTFNDLRDGKTDSKTLKDNPVLQGALGVIGVSFLGKAISTAGIAALGVKGGITVKGLSIIGGPIAIAAVGAGYFFKKHKEKKRQAEIDQRLKDVYQEGFEQATEELIKQYRESEAEKEKLIKIIKEMRKYQEEFEKKKEAKGAEIVAYNYAKGITDGFDAQLPMII